MSQLPVWGIDVSASSLRAVQLSAGDDGRIRFEAWDVIDFAEDVEDVRGVGRYDAMARAVKRFVKHQDVRHAKVVASIRGETAFVRTVSVPQLGGESLEKILAYEAQQQIPFPLDEVYWDRRVLAIRDGGEVVVSLYAIRKAQVDDRLRKLALMGLPIDAVQLRPLALQNFCAAEKLLTDGTVVVDYDFSGLQILVAHEDRVWFRCLPAGACDFVEKLRLKLRVDHGEAVRLATGAAAPRPGQAKTLEELRAAAAREAAAETAGQLRYYMKMHPGARPDRVLLFTSHRACPPLAQALANETGLKIAEPRGFRHIDVAADVVAAGLQENFSGLARAAGLALHGLGKADTAVRLYPDAIPRTFSRGKAGYAVAAVAALGSVVLGWGRQEELGAKLNEAASNVRARVAVAREFDRARIEAPRLGEDPVAPLVAKWTARSKDRDGRAPFAGALLAALASPGGKPRDEARAPRLVALEAGDAPGRAAPAGTGRLVLAAVEDGDVERTDRELDAFVATLVGTAGLRAAKPTDGWSAASPQGRKPTAADERMLRVRFRHRAYDLSFEESR
jgi:type IV pilus assembly protein PilM